MYFRVFWSLNTAPRAPSGQAVGGETRTWILCWAPTPDGGQDAAVAEVAEFGLLLPPIIAGAPGPRNGAVTESAGACSYYSISTGTQTAHPPAVPFLTPGSKSVLYILCSVRKCLTHSI